MNLERIMGLGRLNAMSEGREAIEFKDFLAGKELADWLV